MADSSHMSRRCIHSCLVQKGRCPTHRLQLTDSSYLPGALFSPIFTAALGHPARLGGTPASPRYRASYPVCPSGTGHSMWCPGPGPGKPATHPRASSLAALALNSLLEALRQGGPQPHCRPFLSFSKFPPHCLGKLVMAPWRGPAIPRPTQHSVRLPKISTSVRPWVEKELWVREVWGTAASMQLMRLSTAELLHAFSRTFRKTRVP